MKRIAFAGVSVLATLVLTMGLPSPGFGDSDRPLSSSPFDPNSRQVEMFSALEEGTIQVKLVPANSKGGSLFITNTTQEPLTVKVPQGFVGVPVLAQFGLGGNAGGGGGLFGGGGNGLGNQGGGGLQAVGGGTGNNTAGGGAGNGIGAGGGFFSIPPEKTLRVHYVSVCLEHGKLEPIPRANYAVVPVERYTDDPVLREIVQMVGSGRLDQHSAQAAAWHVANHMSWEQLAAKSSSPVPVAGREYFSSDNLKEARQIVAAAEIQAQKLPAAIAAPATASVRNGR